MAEFKLKMGKLRKDFLEREAKVYYQTYLEVVDAVKYYAKRQNIGLVLRFNGEPVDPNRREDVLREINKPVVMQDRSTSRRMCSCCSIAIRRRQPVSQPAHRRRAVADSAVTRFAARLADAGTVAERARRSACSSPSHQAGEMPTTTSATDTTSLGSFTSMSVARRQRTLARPVSVTGFGYFSGRDMRVEFWPAAEHAGITFVRHDIGPAARDSGRRRAADRSCRGARRSS